MELQARFFALICSNKKVLPSPIEVESVASMDRVAALEQFEKNAQRIRSLMDYFKYMDSMAATSNVSHH